MTLNKSLAVIAASACIALLFSVIAVFAWDGPTAAPPSNNVPAPLNVSAINQTKTGGLLNVYNLWVDSSLGVTGGITSSQYCFTGLTNCISAWPGTSIASAEPLYATVLNTTTNATSTFLGGINLTGGCLAVNGVCISQQQQLLDVQCVAVYAAPSYIYCVRISDGVVISKENRNPWIQISNGDGWPGGSSWQCSGGIVLFCTRVTDGVVAAFDGSAWSYNNGDGWTF